MPMNILIINNKTQHIMDISNLRGKIQSVTGNESAATISNQESDILIEGLAAKKSNMEKDVAFGHLAIICQKGGTARRAQGTVSSVINGVKVDLSEVRAVMRDKNIKYTLRQWARTNANEIHTVSTWFDIPGDLAKKITRESSDFNENDTIWMSNFQMDNPNCPDNVRNALMDHYRDLFPGKSGE